MHLYGLLSLLLIVSAPVFGYELTYNPTNGHYYKIYVAPNGISQTSASNIAKSKYINGKPGYLVTIGDAAESQFLVQLFSTKLYPYNTTLPLTARPGVYPSFWTGAMRPSSEQSWYWFATNRQSITFYSKNKCAAGSYCNLMSQPDASHSCMRGFLYNTYGPGLGLWKSADCSMIIDAYIIEFDDSANCAVGFTKDNTKGWCIDVDECATAGRCPTNATCSNTVGSYICVPSCSGGYVLNTDSNTCVDVNECLNTTICDKGYTCSNTPGSYQCQDINECAAVNPCGAGFNCANTQGSYDCNDIDECAVTPSPCPADATCSNLEGSYACDSLYKYIVSQLNGLVLDTVSNEVGSQVVLAVRTDSTSQLWRQSEEGYITNKANGLVLDVTYGKFDAGSPMILWYRKPVEDAYNQLWTLTTTGYIKAKMADYVLDMPRSSDGTSAPGTHIVLWYMKGDDNTNQLWRFDDFDN